MMQELVHIALVVRDYDEALAFYVGKLGFVLLEDTYQPEQDKRWVVVAPPGSSGTTLLLAKASKPGQQDFIGNQAGGRVFLFLNTDDFWRDYRAMVAKGITFVREPKEAPYGTVAVFADLYGNLWDLLQLHPEHPIARRGRGTAVPTAPRPPGVPMIIRPEAEADLPAIDRIHTEAFLHHPHSHQTEHLIVRALRASGALTLSLVAELESRIVGHIAFSPARIDGREAGWYTLGPVGVLPAFQGKGVGSTLIRTGLEGLRALQAEGCLLVGDPGYYTRFGFRSFPSLRLHGVPPEFFLGLPFSETIPAGDVTHHPAFLATT